MPLCGSYAHGHPTLRDPVEADFLNAWYKMGFLAHCLLYGTFAPTHFLYAQRKAKKLLRLININHSHAMLITR